jgi:U3 small nucleolar ribonucleoprotein protein LCP5
MKRKAVDCDGPCLHVIVDSRQTSQTKPVGEKVAAFLGNSQKVQGHCIFQHNITMATANMDTSLASILPGLTSSLESAIPALPTSDSILPPANGITLLDAKNELFLSYLQTLALRNLAVIRSAKDGKTAPVDFDNQLVRDLVKHRVYLEKGVRPLEDRLKYQIDKVVRAAEDEARGSAQKAAVVKQSTAAVRTAPSDSENSNDEDASDSDADSDDGLAFRPNPSALTRPSDATEAPSASSSKPDPSTDGIYRPPRINATTMPAPPSPRREKGDRKPMRSNTIDEFVADELSGAPTAQPSIGSTITALGRRDKSARERKEEAERTAYEESNLVRLPKEGKKERAKKGGNNRGGYGGEEWDLLGQGIGRIDRLTKKGERTGAGGVGGALERSRKRKNDDGGAGGAGGDMGREFERRKKRAMRRN